MNLNVRYYSGALIKLLAHFLAVIGKSLLILSMAWITAGFIFTFIHLFYHLNYSDRLFEVGMGFGLGMIVFTFLSPFFRLYIFGHELSHWVMAKIFRRKTGKFRIGKSSGSVQIDRPNIWIVLAPYFIPIFVIIWMVVVKIVDWWLREKWVTTIFYGGIGFFYAYHVIMTVFALSKKQSDLQFFGRVFSLSMIVTINVATIFWGIMYFSGMFKAGNAYLFDTYQWQINTAMKFIKTWF